MFTHKLPQQKPPAGRTGGGLLLFAAKKLGPMLSAPYHLEYGNILRLVSHWQAAFFFVKGSFVEMTESGTLICEY